MLFRSIVLILMALVVLASVLYLRRPPPPVDLSEREKGIVPPAPVKPSLLPSPLRVTAPALKEVQPTLDRVFDQTVIVDEATQPAFLAGDFNGDDVTDLAVAVRPRGDALPRLNAELPNWSIQDATAPPTNAVTKPEALKVAAGDLLLAVIHGQGVGGWRDPDALQGYLVRNAVGSDMRLQPLARVPDAIRMKVNRSHTGDVIVEDRGGARGLIFWDGARYLWSPLRRASSGP